MAKGDYIRIRYTNSKDFAGLIFSDGYYYDLFLEGTLGQVQCETLEYGNKNENNEFDPTKIVKEFSLKLLTFGGEWMYRLLNLISLCDTVFITNKLGETSKVLEMKVEGDTKNISLFNVKLIIDRVIWESCASPLAAMVCPTSTQDLVDTINIDSATYTTPGGSIGEYYAIYDNTVGSDTYGKTAIAKRVAAPVNWEYVSPGFADRFKDITLTDFYYVIKIDDEPVGDFVPVTQLPTFTSLVNNGDGTMTALGQCLDGFMLQMYESTDDITFNNVGSVITASAYNVSGLTFTATPGCIYFKLALIDYTYTVCLYTESIDGGARVLFTVEDLDTSLGIENATVLFKNSGGTTLETLTTDVNGQCTTVNSYAMDNYKYTASHPDYITEADTVFTVDEVLESVTIQLQHV